eukprot:7010165-Prymnesium_polylepis.2
MWSSSALEIDKMMNCTSLMEGKAFLMSKAQNLQRRGRMRDTIRISSFRSEERRDRKGRAEAPQLFRDEFISSRTDAAYASPIGRRSGLD